MKTTLDTNDEIDLLYLLSVLLRRKRLIVAITIICAVGVFIFALLTILLPPNISPLPNLYTPKAHMLINDASSQGGGLSSMLSSSGLGGLASLAGVSLPSGSTYNQLAVYLSGTNEFLDSIIDTYGLVERYRIKKSPKTLTRLELKKNLTASFDDKSGVFSVAFTDYDPVFAQSVVNHAVDYLEKKFKELGVDKNELQKVNLEKNIENTYQQIVTYEGQSRKLEQSVSLGGNVPSIMLDITRIKMEIDAQKQVYAQLKVQYELLKVQMASESPIFQVLERAEVPDKKSEPSRGILCAIVTFAAFFAAVMLAFVLEAVDNVRKDPQAMKKLTGAKE